MTVAGARHGSRTPDVAGTVAELVNPTQRERRVAAGDPLRAIAALSVLGFHVALVVALPVVRPGPSGLRDAMVATFGDAVGELSYGLRLGLGLFFVLSGYLLSRPLARAWNRGEPTPDPVGYGVNRVLRIVPAFWVVAVLTLVAVGPGRMVFADIATVFGFVQIYRDGTLSYYLGQAWSLDTEVQFYLLLGVVLVLARVVIRRPPTWTIVVAVLGAAFLVSAWLRELTPADGPWALSLPAMLQAFLPGVALAWIEDPALDALARRPRLATWLPTALLVAAASVAAIHITRSARFDALESITSSLVAGCLLAAALVREWTTGRSWKLLDHPVLRWLGVRSYGIFLYHWGLAVLLAPVVATIESPVARALALLLLVVPTAALAAAISWSLIEKPALGFRRRWRARGATT